MSYVNNLLPIIVKIVFLYAPYNALIQIINNEGPVLSSTYNKNFHWLLSKLYGEQHQTKHAKVEFHSVPPHMSMSH